MQEVKEFGLNQLWLVVFEEGKTLLPGTEFPQWPVLKGQKEQPDLLAYTVEAAKKANVIVCPVVELFAWGNETPDDLRGRTLRGEDSLQYEERHYILRKYRTENLPPLPSKKIVWVDPVNPAVQKKLGGLLKKIAACPGIGNIVWNTDVPYCWTNDFWLSQYSPCGLFSYDNMALRLTFLREEHFDPIDGNSKGDYLSGDFPDSFFRTNFSLPEYNKDDYGYRELALQQYWVQLCYDEMYERLCSMYTDMVAGMPDTGRPSVLLMESNKAQSQIWYEMSTFPVESLPESTADIRGVPAAPAADPKNPMPPKKPVSFMRLALPLRYGPLTLERKDWPALLGFQMKQFTAAEVRQWNGIVLEEDDLFPDP